MDQDLDGWDAMDDEFDELDELDEMDDLDAKKRRGRRGGVRVFNLLPKRAFDYSYLLASATTSVVVRRALKVPAFYYYWLGLRIHNKDILSGNYTLQLFQTLPSAQDPQEFSIASASMALQCLSGDTPPTVKTTTSSNLGPYFKVVLLATQGGTAGARLYAELSAVLYARPA